MDQPVWHDICSVFKLGALMDTPRVATGGLQHRLFHVHTERGAYAVKVLNPRLLTQTGRRERYERAEQIAQAAMCTGLPVVAALSGPDGHLQTVGEMTVMVFPWLVGTVLPPTPATPEAAHQIGSLMGRLHALRLVLPNLPNSASPPVPGRSDDHWSELVRQAQSEHVSWADGLAAALPDLVEWDRSAQTALQNLTAHSVLTHRDMDQKNVLWADPQTPWLLDWEDAGPMPPMQEVMGTALNWAGQAAGPPSGKTFAAFLSGYDRAAPIDGGVLRHAAVAVLDKWLVWLEFNMRRSLSAFGASPAEQALAGNAVDHSLATLKQLAADTDTRLRWCDALPSSD